jgi:hypothetical protein
MPTDRDERAMSGKDERVAWMKEHLSYELLMMRFAHNELNWSDDQLEWNANYSAFALHARNLYLFLTSDKDSRIYKASDYTNLETDGKPLHGIMDNLNQQTFHPGKQRNGAKKVGLDKAAKVYTWVEKYMDEFIDKLNEPYKSAWDEIRDKADLLQMCPERVRRGRLPSMSHTSHMVLYVTESNHPPTKIEDVT